MNIKQRRLPAEYQEVEWIRSDGSQAIKTPATTSNNTVIEIKTYIENDNSPFGGSGSTGTDAFNVTSAKATGAISVRFGSFYANVYEVYAYGQDAVLKLGQNGFYANSVLLQTFDQMSFSNPANLYLFARQSGGDKMIGKIYYAKIYESNELIYNFIPCYRLSDNEIGMYDLVNGVFYTNQGTGSFTKGADVVTVDAVTIPEGSVTRVVDGSGNVVWKKPLVFNQLIQNGDFSDGTIGWAAENVGAVTISASNNELTVTSTNIGYGSLVASGYRGNVIAGHNYFYTVTHTNASNRLSLKISATSMSTGSILITGTDVVSDGIISCLYSEAIFFNIWNNTNFSLKNCMLIDLTAMYGAGNEPTDVDTVKADCKSLGYDLSTYQAYTPIT